MRRSQKSRIRSNMPLGGDASWLFQEGQSMSRNQALLAIQTYLDLSELHPYALRLIELFNIVPEELSEAGVSYEALKTLENRALFI